MRLLLLVFGTMALQNSVFAWCSGHRTPPPARGRCGSRPVLGAARLLVLAHRLDAARVPERQARLQQHPRPEARPDARLPAPLLPAARAARELRPAAARRACCFRDVWGMLHPRRRSAPGVEPPRHLLHQFPRAHVGHAALHRGQHARATTRCWPSSPTARATTTSTTSSRTTTATACAGGSGTRPSG